MTISAVAKQPVQKYIGAKALPATGGVSSKLFSSREYIGVELEYENLDALALKKAFSKWEKPVLFSIKQDHSLKYKGLELLFKRALCGSHVVEALKQIFMAMKQGEVQPYIAGNRCSTHVHINITDLNVGQLKNFVLFAYFCEPALMDVCAADRRNNTFTINIDRLRDFESILHAIETGNLQFSETNGKYRAIGLNSIYNLGSLEFRMFNGSTDINQIIDWINFVMEIKHIAITRENILEDILSVMSSSPDDVMNKLFSRNISLSEDARSCMWDFVRDFYTQQDDNVGFGHKFSPFYLSMQGE